MSIDSSMVKLADQARINRREFIDEYRGYELDPGWVARITEKTGRGWQALIEKSREKVEDLRAEMAQVGQYVGVDITEFRRIVAQVQKGEKEARQAKKEMVEANLRQMLHEIGREPTPEELAEKLQMPLEKVRKVMKIAKEPISLETPIGDEEDSQLGDFIEDKNGKTSKRQRPVFWRL